MRTLFCALLASLALGGAANAAGCVYDSVNQIPTTQGSGVALPSAASADWYRNKAAIEIEGRRYQPFGLPMEVAQFEMEAWMQIGVWKGVPVFLDEYGEGEVAFVAVDPKVCSFQRYEALKD
ncbi:MAG: hypothetical protein K0R83_1962 [Caulobacter sp.]|jgi:hypothetical protein|nr:hypothetical protein [Caulobacter sp.]